jgi:hypothetical protein
MPTTKTKTPKITFKDFMKIWSTLKSSTCCVNENHSFYIYRADTHQVLARGLDGYEAAKTAANQLRHSLGLKWDQIGFKKEPKPTGGPGASGGGNSRSRSTGARYDRSSRYNPSKRGLDYPDHSARSGKAA